MFDVIWDQGNNGVLLVETSSNRGSNGFPRPVFFEELDLLGFNRYWKYPRVQEPLLWAVGRRYFFNGEPVAEVQGGNLFENPTIQLLTEDKELDIEPVDLEHIVNANKEILYILENEALDFVEHVYRAYVKKKYKFAVSFSGGKDSQTVLDLVLRVLPPDELAVIFSDTGMEISQTYECIKETKKYYARKYARLQFHAAKPQSDTVQLWRQFGPPSRLHRWCCTVVKTAPFLRKMQEIHGANGNGNGGLRVVVFDGVRADESNRRSQYSRIAAGEKHAMQVNAEVIRLWNTTEVFLYLFYRDLPMNRGYRYGLTRIGCSVCPFASEWSEYILKSIDSNLVSKYVNVLQDHCELLGIHDPDRMRRYIGGGQWKKRAGGAGVLTQSHVQFLHREGEIEAVIKNPSENFLVWGRTMGDVIYKERDPSTVTGEIRIGDRTYPFNIKRENNTESIRIKTFGDKDFRNKAVRVLYKTTFCKHCGGCEIECPTGALKVSPKVSIDTNLCARCGNCLFFTERGCLLAKSLQVAEEGRGMKGGGKLAGFGRYETFGMRDDWVAAFLRSPDDWFSNNSLGPKQVDSMRSWLIDSELIDSKTKTPTDFARDMQVIYFRDRNLAWQILWVNLVANSNVCSFFAQDVPWGQALSKAELVSLALDVGNGTEKKGRTVESGISSLINMFRESPLGRELQLVSVETRGRAVKRISKLGLTKAHPLAIAYNMYKLAEKAGRRDFTVKEIYEERLELGPYSVFGLPRSEFQRILRGLQEDRERILRVSLVADLDNIFLRDDLSAKQIAQIARERLA